MRKVTSVVGLQGVEIETLDSSKFLGVHINNKLDWTDNRRRRMRDKPGSILGYPSHPLYVELWQIGSIFRPRPHEAETGETVTVSINPVSQYLRKDGVKRNREDL